MGNNETFAAQAELWLDDGGEGYGVVVPMGKTIESYSLEDWRAQDKDLHALLVKKLEEHQGLYQLPPRPDLDAPMDNLHTDLTRFIAGHVWCSEERAMSTMAHWVICSYVQHLLPYSVRLVFVGSMRSGKTRALRTLASVSYRSVLSPDASGPALFRLIELHRPTVFRDEYQAMGEEQRQSNDQILRNGFEPNSRVLRAESDGKGLLTYDVYAPVAIGSKGRLPPEDILSRSLVFVMQEKPAEAEIARTIDMEAAAKLRARLLAFRMRCLIGEVNVAKLVDDAQKKAMESIFVTGREVNLNDRSIDKAQALLAPAMFFGDCDDALELLAQSEVDSDDALRETFEGQCFYALRAVIDLEKREKGIAFDPTSISITDVTEQLNTDLQMQGNAPRDPVHTRRVGVALRALGFRFNIGRANKSFFDPSTFESALQINTRKFGLRPRSSPNQINPDVTKQPVPQEG